MDVTTRWLCIMACAVFSPLSSVLGLGCFQCNSQNGSDVDCDDPFNAAPGSYHRQCRMVRSGRVGLWVGRFCIKMAGKHVSTGETIVVRTCSMDNMYQQCGDFEFDEVRYRGCLTTCQRDGCNHSNRIRQSFLLFVLPVLNRILIY